MLCNKNACEKWSYQIEFCSSLQYTETSCSSVIRVKQLTIMSSGLLARFTSGVSNVCFPAICLNSTIQCTTRQDIPCCPRFMVGDIFM